MEFVQFSKIVQYLHHPLVLLGFCLFLFFGILSGILKSGLLSPLSQRQSSTILRQILNYGLSVAIILIVLGVIYAGFLDYHSANVGHREQGPITQQAGNCGSNIVGDNNKATLDCVNQETKTK